VGCGLSHWVDIFNEEHYDIYGVDYAPKVVEMINKKKPELKIRFRGMFLKLDFKDEFFGTYFSWGVG
jgi:ubiquinone/menaquinone biosynthesis C-methylase UbiE